MGLQNRHALPSPRSEAAARRVHRIDLGVSERLAAARARADPADRRRTVDREPERGSDAALRSGVAHRYVATSGSVLSGAQSRFQVIDTSEQEYVAGVAFKPGGTVPFTRMPAHEACDADVPLEALWGCKRTATLRERLLESGSIEAKLDALEAVLHEMWRPARAASGRRFCVGRVRSSATDDEHCRGDRLHRAKREAIHRAVQEEVGITPKVYCRIRRFQRAVTMATRGRQVEWTRVALDCGYFDQAHFIHDFRSFAGLTPTAYQSARTSFQNHVKFLQSGADGI